MKCVAVLLAVVAVAVATPTTYIQHETVFASSKPASSSPLVEIILNVQNNNAAVVDQVVDVPITPSGPSHVIERPTPQYDPHFNPIDILAPLPVEALNPSAAAAIGPM